MLFITLLQYSIVFIYFKVVLRLLLCITLAYVDPTILILDK